jgi:hypothetical protein
MPDRPAIGTWPRETIDVRQGGSTRSPDYFDGISSGMNSRLERMTGIEPAIFGLGSRRVTSYATSAH